MAKQKVGIPGEKIQFACTIRELYNWIEKSHGTERFIIMSIIIGLLSLAVALISLKEKRKIPPQGAC